MDWQTKSPTRIPPVLNTAGLEVDTGRMARAHERERDERGFEGLAFVVGRESERETRRTREGGSDFMRR
jgi:hypothetical protein